VNWFPLCHFAAKSGIGKQVSSGKESVLETSPAFFFTATLYLKLCCANSAKSKKRLIAKINIGGFLGKPQSYTPSSHCPTTMV